MGADACAVSEAATGIHGCSQRAHSNVGVPRGPGLPEAEVAQTKHICDNTFEANREGLKQTHLASANPTVTTPQIDDDVGGGDDNADAGDDDGDEHDDDNGHSRSKSLEIRKFAPSRFFAFEGEIPPDKGHPPNFSTCLPPRSEMHLRLKQND